MNVILFEHYLDPETLSCIHVVDPITVSKPSFHFHFVNVFPQRKIIKLFQHLIFQQVILVHCFGFAHDKNNCHAPGYLFKDEIVPVEPIAHAATVVSFFIYQV